MAAEKPPTFLHRTGTAVREFLHAALRPHAARRSVVVCPRDQMPAAVTLDADNRLHACSRRKDEATCSEDCIPQLQYAAEDLETFLRRNRGQSCRVCGKAIGANDWYKSRLAPAHRPHADSRGAAPAAALPICCDCLR